MSTLAILDLTDVKEDCKSKHLSELTLSDLFLEINYKNNTRGIILCINKEFKVLKKWGKPAKDDRVYDVAYLNKVIASL